MSITRAALIILAIASIIPACAPRVTVAPIPPDTPPEQVVEMVRQREAGLDGIRALVKITAKESGGEPLGFDGVLYVARPDRVRLTGLSFLGFTVFDAVIRADRFYFYQPDTGYLYTGQRNELGGFLKSMGIKADPELIYRALFFEMPAGSYRHVYENTGNGYTVYYIRDDGGLMRPDMRAEYDAGLNLVRKVFYDGLARPYLYVVHEGIVEQDGFSLPKRITATDTGNGYSLTIDFEKYLVNPEGLDEDFTIMGGELKEIRTLE